MDVRVSDGPDILLEQEASFCQVHMTSLQGYAFVMESEASAE